MVTRLGLAGLTLLVSVVVAASAATTALAAAPGSPDATWGGTGVVQLTSGTQLLGVAVAPDGEVVAVGQTNGSIYGGSIYVARYSAQGKLENQYVGPDGVLRSVALQPDGKIVVAGTSGGAMFIERLTAGLTPDASFGSGGIVTLFGGQSGLGNGVAVSPDGSIVAVGTVGGYDSSFAVARFTAAGKVIFSESFQPRGFPYAVASAVTVQDNGAIVIAGSQQGDITYGYTVGLVLRLTPSGAMDTSFNGSGLVSYIHPGAAYTAFQAVALQNDGKIVAAGVDDSGPNAITMRLDPNGSADSSFGSAGVATLPSGMNTSTSDPVGAYGVGIAGGGHIVAAGNYENGGNDDQSAAWAWTAAGHPETTFGSGGTLLAPTSDQEVCGLSIAPDGSLVTVGNAVTTNPDQNPCAANSTTSAYIARAIGFGPPPANTPPPPPPPPPVSGPPGAITGGATVTEISSRVTGQVQPHGLPTTYKIQYGRTKELGTSTPSSQVKAGSGEVGVTSILRHLRPGTTYQYRLVATNADGSRYGRMRSFKTLPTLAARLAGLRPTYHLSAIAHQGLKLRVSCNQPCTIAGALTISPASARSLGLGDHSLTIGKGSARLRHSGSASLVLRLTIAAQHALLPSGHATPQLLVGINPVGGGTSVHDHSRLSLTP
jgi:uncharacterized delta-60 repeat protein